MNHNKIALVTGAGTGIGKATTAALLNAGYCVTLTGRREPVLQDAVQELGATEQNTLVCAADVTQEDQVDQLFQRTREKFGRLDLLFNNAGVSAPSSMPEDLTLAQWQTVIDCNLTGPFLCTRAAIRLMKEQQPQGGRIINNGSIAATTPRPLSLPYAATKHAISGMTKSTSLDCRQHNIAVCQIDIGNAATEMAHGVTVGAPQANGETAIEPTMDVEHVANAVVHMASLPLDANILFLTVMATRMPFVGRG